MSRRLRHAEQKIKIHETGWRDGERMQKGRDETEDTQKVSKGIKMNRKKLEGGREEYRNATSMWTIYILQGKLTIKHTWIRAHVRLYNLVDQQSSKTSKATDSCELERTGWSSLVTRAPPSHKHTHTQTYTSRHTHPDTHTLVLLSLLLIACRSSRISGHRGPFQPIRDLSQLCLSALIR